MTINNRTLTQIVLATAAIAFAWGAAPLKAGDSNPKKRSPGNEVRTANAS